MLLNFITRSYIYIGITLYVLFSAFNIETPDFMAMHLVSFCFFLLYGITIYESSLQSNMFFKAKNLAIIVLGISIIEVVILQLLSFYIDGDTFVFSKADAWLYNIESMKMAKMSLQDGILYISGLGYGVDDLGAFLWSSIIFKMVSSQQFLNLSYCIVGTLTAVMLFDIGRNFMPRRYAFLASLSFSLASFNMVLRAQSLKETIMICIIVASFEFFLTFLRKKKHVYLWLTVLCSIAVFLFRVPTALLLLFSFSLTLGQQYLKGKAAIIFSIIIISFISATPIFSYTYDRYLRGGDASAIIERKNELSDGGGIVNQITDPVAALMGPFPSIRVNVIKPTPLYASGLLYRFLLSAPFFIGIFFLFKEKNIWLYPFAIFFLINAIGIAVSVKGLETRLSMPHLAMMYIVAFWFLAKYDYDKLSLRITPKLQYGYIIIILGLCLLWNLR